VLAAMNTGRTIERALDIAASPAWLFDLTQDYTKRLDWDPFLVVAELRPAGTASAGVGARAWCVSRFPRWGMETEYVTFKRPDVVAIKMTQGPRMLTKFAGSWRFDAMDAEVTRVTFRYHFETSPTALAPFAARVFAWDMQKRLEGLRAYATQHTAHGVTPAAHNAGDNPGMRG
jgi:ribosome-associated toxin RatA of RatAB toxin-antitoxin module